MDAIDKWLKTHKGDKGNAVTINPSTYPNGRMDDPDVPSVKVLGAQHEPIVNIKTVDDDTFKRITGGSPEVKGEIIRVNSPPFTTQPNITMAIDDIPQRNMPTIRVVEGGRGTPETVTPFINPYALAGSNLSHSSLLEPDKHDPKGRSTTHNYDELRNRMGNMKMRIDGEEMDILLPSDVTDDFSGTRISIGNVPGRLAVNSKENGFYDDKPVGTKKKTRPLTWDGEKDPNSEKDLEGFR